MQQLKCFYDTFVQGLSDVLALNTKKTTFAEAKPLHAVLQINDTTLSERATNPFKSVGDVTNWQGHHLEQ